MCVVVPDPALVVNVLIIIELDVMLHICLLWKPIQYLSKILFVVISSWATQTHRDQKQETV